MEPVLAEEVTISKGGSTVQAESTVHTPKPAPTLPGPEPISEADALAQIRAMLDTEAGGPEEEYTPVENAHVEGEETEEPAETVETAPETATEAAVEPSAPDWWKGSEDAWKALPADAKASLATPVEQPAPAVAPTPEIPAAQPDQIQQATQQYNAIQGEFAQLSAMIATEFPDVKTPQDRLALSQADPARSHRLEVMLRRSVELDGLAGRIQGWAQQQVSAQARAQRDAELARIPNLIPEWRDPKARTEGLNRVLDAMVADGLIASREAPIKAEAIKRMHQALKFEATPTQDARAKAIADKKVIGLPPAVRPGVSTAGNAGNSVAEQLTRRFQKSGNEKDALAAIAARL